MTRTYTGSIATFPLAGGWKVWPWVAVRGSALPASLVLGLAEPDLLAIAETADAEAEACRATFAAIIAGFPKLGSREQNRLVKLLDKHEVPETTLVPAAVLGELRAAHARHVEADARFAAAVDAAWNASVRVLATLHERDDLMCALELQNPRMAEEARRFGDGHYQSLNARDRGKQLVLAAYLARYCLRCETIGRFNPLAWGSVSEATSGFELRVGSRPVSRRRVFMELWACEELARALFEDRALVPWLWPRVPAEVVVSELDPSLRGVVELCSGERSLADIRRLACETGMSDADFERAWAGALAAGAVQQRPVLVRGRDAPQEGLVALRTLVARVGDPDRRAALTAAIDEIDELRGALERADTAAAMRDGLRRLEQRFSERCGTATYRPQAGFGRTLVYEDALRDAEVQIGAAWLARLGPSLAVVLESASWFTSEYLRAFERLFEAAFDRLGGAPVSLIAVLRESGAPLVVPNYNVAEPWLASVVAELDRRWARVIEVAGPTATPEALWPLVQEAFPRQDTSCDFHSVDLLLAAPSTEALEAGDLVAVVGELHANYNPFLIALFLDSIPDRDEVLKLGRTTRLGYFNPPTTTSWRIAGVTPPGVLTLEFPESVTGAQVMHGDVRAGELTVERRDGRLITCGPAGDTPLREILRWFALRQAVQHFRIRAPGQTRLRLGSLVVQRESWRIDEEVVLGHDRLADGYRAIVAWARASGVPRFVFAAPAADKPFYVDFASPIYVDQLRRTLKTEKSLALFEMLPAHGELWMRDCSGEPCVGELRVVIQHPWDDPRGAASPRSL